MSNSVVSESNEWIHRQILPQTKQHWSYQPLRKCIAEVQGQNHQSERNPIDALVGFHQKKANLREIQIASRSRLLRRLYFDLIGLPPNVVEIEEFLADLHPDVLERTVDRLLANPHYGERWCRHWLDIVRYGESHGFEHDYDRASAYHFRDFVVQALNAGMPYDQFVRWQIAGDELAPNERLAFMATGFLAAGVHSTQITQNEVEKHRYDEMDDMLSTIGTSMLGLTIGCARCHDHTSDAIPQSDYYRLLSTFTTTVRCEVELDFDPVGYQRACQEFEREHATYERLISDYEKEQLSQRYVEWQARRDADGDDFTWVIPDTIDFASNGHVIFSRQSDHSWLVSGANPESDIWKIEFDTKLTDIQSIRLETLADSSFVRSGPGRSDDGNFALSEIKVTIRPIGVAVGAHETDVPLVTANATFAQNGFPATAAIDNDPKSAWSVDPEFGKDHAIVFTSAGPFGFKEGTTVIVMLKFSEKTRHAIGRPRLTISRKRRFAASVTSGLIEQIYSLTNVPFDRLAAEQKKQILDWYKVIDPEWKALDEHCRSHTLAAPKPRIQRVLIATEGVPPLKFNTQAEAKVYDSTHFLRRGEPRMKDGVARPGFLQVLMANPDLSQRFQLQPPSGSRTSFRRASLTNWLVDQESGAGNLLARVIVNRVWQHHLGRGIVATPSDFGVDGSPPTHPELLEWLAIELVRNHWNLKPIHRQIVTSRAYQEESRSGDVAARDADENQSFQLRSPRRIEAEVVRDAILAVGGLLDDRMLGPGQFDARSQRRSLYFAVKRSRPVGALTVFDTPDATTTVAERSESTVAPQALFLMNDPHVREASRRFAESLFQLAKSSLEDAVRQAYLAALGREPKVYELKQSIQFLNHQSESYASSDVELGLTSALVDFCQVLFCLNEFVYVY